MTDRFARPVDVFVGYDEGESVAFHVCVNSLVGHASQPLRIMPLALNNLAQNYTERHGDGSTTFAYSRFLAPYLSGFMGYSLFIDGDMLVKDDIVKLFDAVSSDINSALWVVKHDYTPKARTKFRGASQIAYPKKNWSSVMLFRNSSSFCKQLTPEYVEQSSGAHLHQFQWLPEGRVGELPREWNHLVGEYEHSDDAKILHYTNGVPAFSAYADCDHASEWFDEFHRVVHVDE